MSGLRVQTGTDLEQIAIVLPTGGLTMKLEVRRASDGKYWTGLAWDAAVTALSMTADNLPVAGSLYYYDLDTNHASWSYEGQVQCIAYAGTTLYGSGSFHIGEWADDVASAAAVVTALKAWAVETGVTYEQAMQAILAATAGVAAGAATTTMTFDAAMNPGTTRITATVDASGNRSSVTLS
jgi:hypothetical protein